MDDLVRLVAAKMDEPVDLVAQSMGGVIAARLALERPDLVRRLVLVVTSGGVNMAGFGAADWRPDYRKSFPRAVEWITAARSAPELSVEKITAPTLLIWGDADAISPLAVGRHLEQRIPERAAARRAGRRSRPGEDARRSGGVADRAAPQGLTVRPSAVS